MSTFQLNPPRYDLMIKISYFQLLLEYHFGTWFIENDVHNYPSWLYVATHSRNIFVNIETSTPHP